MVADIDEAGERETVQFIEHRFHVKPSKADYPLEHWTDAAEPTHVGGCMELVWQSMRCGGRMAA